jgi:hypothetical protein
MHHLLCCVKNISSLKKERRKELEPNFDKEGNKSFLHISLSFFDRNSKPGEKKVHPLSSV